MSVDLKANDEKDRVWRTEERIKITLPIIVEWKNKNVNRRVITTTKNISLKGVMFHIDAEEIEDGLEVNREIIVYARQGEVSSRAIVRHISNEGEGTIQVGVELREPLYAWLINYKMKMMTIKS